MVKRMREAISSCRTGAVSCKIQVLIGWNSKESSYVQDTFALHFWLEMGIDDQNGAKTVRRAINNLLLTNPYAWMFDHIIVSLGGEETTLIP